MEPFRDENELIAELHALRPAPRPAFAAALDERAAAGFPRSPLPGGWRPERLTGRLRSVPRRRIAFSAAAAALASVAIATAVVVNTEPNGNSSRSGHLNSGSGLLGEIAPAGSAASQSAPDVAEVEGGEAAGLRYTAKPSAASARHRDVERSASMVLGADPADVAGDAAKVSETVHANGGIVLRSSTRDGSEGAGASFDLLIPSARLDDAMAAFAQIDEVRVRHEGSLDITAPTVNASELLRGSRARIDSLLSQLAQAETEAEREAVEAELRAERRHQAALRARLSRLHRRAHFSRVSLRIESGADPAVSGGGAWGVDDALRDAGHVLSVAAGVALIGLAVLAPLALIALLAWLAHRAWLRCARARALG